MKVGKTYMRLLKVMWLMQKDRLNLSTLVGKRFTITPTKQTTGSSPKCPMTNTLIQQSGVTCGAMKFVEMFWLLTSSILNLPKQLIWRIAMYKIINIAEWVGVWLYLIAATWLVAVTR